MTTLTELRLNYPHRFYKQDWFKDEVFMRALSENIVPRVPKVLERQNVKASDRLPLAVDLAAAFVAQPDHPIWERFLWCRDVDRFGQRVYVGGVGEHNGRRFEIHRHLHLTNRWAIPCL